MNEAAICGCSVYLCVSRRHMFTYYFDTSLETVQLGENLVTRTLINYEVMKQGTEHAVVGMLHRCLSKAFYNYQ